MFYEFTKWQQKLFNKKFKSDGTLNFYKQRLDFLFYFFIVLRTVCQRDVPQVQSLQILRIFREIVIGKNPLNCTLSLWKIAREKNWVPKKLIVPLLN